MLKGMKGYQLTPSDLEFIEKMEKDKLVKKLQVMLACLLTAAAAWLQPYFSDWFPTIVVYCVDAMGYFDCPQQDLEEVQRSLKNEMMSMELVYASREITQAVLENVSFFELQ